MSIESDHQKYLAAFRGHADEGDTSKELDATTRSMEVTDPGTLEYHYTGLVGTVRERIDQDKLARFAEAMSNVQQDAMQLNRIEAIKQELMAMDRMENTDRRTKAIQKFESQEMQRQDSGANAAESGFNTGYKGGR